MLPHRTLFDTGFLEGIDPIRGSETGGSVIAGPRGAEVEPAAFAGAAAGHIVQRSRVAVGVRGDIDRRTVAGRTGY